MLSFSQRNYQYGDLSSSILIRLLVCRFITDAGLLIITPNGLVVQYPTIRALVCICLRESLFALYRKFHSFSIISVLKLSKDFRRKNARVLRNIVVLHR